MIDSAIRHLATSRTGRVIAAGEFESLVSIWNLNTQSKESEFATSLDFGGTRLAIDEQGDRCIAGAYRAPGIACYDTRSGRVLWRRKDLKKAQEIAIQPSQSEIACGFEDGPLQIIAMNDGKTLQKVRGCQSLHISPFEPIQFADKPQPAVQSLDGSTIFKIPRETFTILSSCFGHGTIAISESGGPVRCFDTHSGRLLWRYDCPQSIHAIELGYNEICREFLAVEWSYEKGGRKALRLFRRDRGSGKQHPLGSSIVEAFCLQGTRLLSSSGWLIDTATGNLAGHFEFPTKRYPDK